MKAFVVAGSKISRLHKFIKPPLQPLLDEKSWEPLFYLCETHTGHSHLLLSMFHLYGNRSQVTWAEHFHATEYLDSRNLWMIPDMLASTWVSILPHSPHSSKQTLSAVPKILDCGNPESLKSSLLMRLFRYMVKGPWIKNSPFAEQGEPVIMSDSESTFFISYCQRSYRCQRVPTNRILPCILEKIGKEWFEIVDLVTLCSTHAPGFLPFKHFVKQNVDQPVPWYVRYTWLALGGKSNGGSLSPMIRKSTFFAYRADSRNIRRYFFFHDALPYTKLNKSIRSCLWSVGASPLWWVRTSKLVGSSGNGTVQVLSKSTSWQTTRRMAPTKRSRRSFSSFALIVWGRPIVRERGRTLQVLLLMLLALSSVGSCSLFLFVNFYIFFID